MTNAKQKDSNNKVDKTKTSPKSNPNKPIAPLNKVKVPRSTVIAP